MNRPWLVVLALWSWGPARATPLPATLVVEGQKSARVPLAWQSCPSTIGDGDCAHATIGGLEAQLVRTGDRLSAQVEWNHLEWIHRVALELPLESGEVRVIGRDLAPRKVKKAVLGRFDPKWVTIGSTTLLIDDSLDEVTVTPQAKGTLVTLELDNAAARPFVHDARCSHRWQDPNRHVTVPLRLHVAGEKLTARVQILERPVTPLVKSAWPDGRRAALVFTDHADQTTLRTLTALAHGFIEHHLEWTKALFARGPGDRPQLDDPEMVALADKMAKSGAEIVPHSATPKPDERTVTAQALERFERWHTRTWIDHQPETNCEAFGDEGYQAGGRFGIADILASHHYEYVWAEDDASPGDLNLLEPAHLERLAPTVWPLGRVSLGGPSTLWMFRTMWAFLEAKRFYAMYGADRLDKLERERGLHIAHTYLDTYHPKRTKFGLRNVVIPADAKGIPGGPGSVKLAPGMDELLARLEERQARGTLWVPTLVELADRMRLVASVEESVRDESVVTLKTAEPVPGASFVVPKKVRVLVDGKEPKLIRSADGETTFSVDLAAGETTVELKAATD